LLTIRKAELLPIAETELALHISDFLITPAWIIGGVLLWRRKEFGYVIGLGLLFQASMLFILRFTRAAWCQIATRRPHNLRSQVNDQKYEPTRM